MAVVTERDSKFPIYDIHIDFGIRRFGIEAMEQANIGRWQARNEIVSAVPWKGKVYWLSTERVRGPRGGSKIVHQIELDVKRK